MRPFAPLQTVQLSELSSHLNNGSADPSHSPPVIHVILPLSGRLHSFRSFLQMFAKLEDRRLELIVVYFGTNGLNQAKRLAGRSERTQFLALNETFSRGKYINVHLCSYVLILLVVNSEIRDFLILTIYLKL